MENKKGISLIVLVVSVLVLAILASAVIISLSNTNIMEEARKATFKADMAGYKTALELWVADEISQNNEFDRNTVNITSASSNFTEIFGNVPEKYEAGLKVVNGKLRYDTTDEDELEVLTELGMVAGEGGNSGTTRVKVTSGTPTHLVEFDGVIYEIDANTTVFDLMDVCTTGEMTEDYEEEQYFGEAWEYLYKNMHLGYLDGEECHSQEWCLVDLVGSDRLIWTSFIRMGDGYGINNGQGFEPILSRYVTDGDTAIGFVIDGTSFNGTSYTGIINNELDIERAEQDGAYIFKVSVIE